MTVPAKTKDIATVLGYPTNTTARALEDLAAYQVVVRTRDGDSPTSANLWNVAEAQIALMARASGASPELSQLGSREQAQGLFISSPTTEEDISGEGPAARSTAGFRASPDFTDVAWMGGRSGAADAVGDTDNRDQQ